MESMVNEDENKTKLLNVLEANASNELHVKNMVSLTPTDTGCVDANMPSCSANAVCVEVRVRADANSRSTVSEVELAVHDYLLRLKQARCNRSVHISPPPPSDGVEQQHHETTKFQPDIDIHMIVDRILISRRDCYDGQIIALTESALKYATYHFYRVHPNSDPVEHVLDVGGDENDTPVVGSNQWDMPNAEFDDLWENLIFDDNLKMEVLQYVNAMMLMSDRSVDPSIITINRLLLFHGPPGTGKTTLCKALAQRLCVRLNKRYRRSVFVEVNSHSLFSKWFSESGKLVQQLFTQLTALLDDDECLVSVLIDEVESLTMAREQSMARNEPSDAVRVVNALLTQIDYIRRYPNVLIFTTSNLSNAVDEAFVDRADIKRYIGPPSPTAIYSIFVSMIKELQRTSIVSSVVQLYNDPHSLPTARTPLVPLNANKNDPEESTLKQDDPSAVASERLFEISKKCVGLSGRTLRKLPVMAHALLLQTLVPLPVFLEALSKALESELNSRGQLNVKK